MNVILLEKVHNLGELGEKVNVKAGHGRNFLIPKGKAVSATPANVAKFEARRAELEKLAVDKLEAAEARKAKLGDMQISIAHKAGEEGKLFGSVGTADIVQAINDAGGDVAKSEVRLPEGALRNVGDYDIDVELYSDVIVTLKLSIIPE